MSETGETAVTADGNDVLYDAHPAMFRGNPLGFILAVLLIAAFGVGLLILLYWWISCRQTRVTLDRHHTLVERGLLSKDRIEMRHSRVRAVHVYQTFFQRIFGVGKVQIYTTGDAPEVTINNMPDPHRIREIINEHGT